MLPGPMMAAFTLVLMVSSAVCTFIYFVEMVRGAHPDFDLSSIPGGARSAPYFKTKLP
jgi:hypothetical protein